MLLLGTRQLLQQLTTVPSFDCLGERLLPLRSTIDLGLVVDFHLTFNEHTCIQQLLASCTAKLCQINRVKHVFNHETLNLSIIINAWVIIKIDYCSVINFGLALLKTISRKYNLLSILQLELLLGGKSLIAILWLYVNK